MRPPTTTATKPARRRGKLPPIRRHAGRATPLTARQRGVALLMVLAAISLLYVMAEQSREEVEVYSLSAFAARDQLIAEYQAKSAVNLARVVLHAEPTIRRAITPILAPIMALMGRGLSAPPQIPIWEQADLIIGPFRGQDGGSALGQLANVDFADGKNLGGLTGLDSVRVIDEDSKINVNSLVRSSVASIFTARQFQGLVANPELNPFFEQRDADGQFTDRLTLFASIVDYVDWDESQFDTSLLNTNAAQSGGGGSEDPIFYSSLKPPYRRRNAPLDSVDELRMIRGLGDDDLWSRVVDPDPGNPTRRTVTVWGQGGVNVNTANAQTLLALICAFAVQAPQCNDASQASQFITSITMVQALTLSMGIPLFNSPQSFVATLQGRPPLGPMLQQLGLQPFTIPDSGALERNIAVESKVFSVYAEATVGGAHTRVHAVIDMRPQPQLPSTFLRASGATLAPTSTGMAGVVSASGGTIIHWRED
jgi:general secretion pathway protein K